VGAAVQLALLAVDSEQNAYIITSAYAQAADHIFLSQMPTLQVCASLDHDVVHQCIHE